MFYNMKWMSSDDKAEHKRWAEKKNNKYKKGKCNYCVKRSLNTQLNKGERKALIKWKVDWMVIHIFYQQVDKKKKKIK